MMSLAIDGYEFLERFIAPEIINAIKAELETVTANELQAGIRNAEKKFITVNDLVNSPRLTAKASQYLGCPAKLIRAIVFDKTVENNWLVAWHQDKTVCVSTRKDLKDWGPWSIKDDAHHVQPPLAVLEEIITFRIHIDDSTRENGCLKLIPASHTLGILSAEQIQTLSHNSPGVDCVAESGTVLAMKPLLLHASSKATDPQHRRVVHAEYTSSALLW
jgi:hypothetical protein